MADRQARSRDRCLALTLTESETNRRNRRRQDGGPYEALRAAAGEFYEYTTDHCSY